MIDEYLQAFIRRVSSMKGRCRKAPWILCVLFLALAGCDSGSSGKAPVVEASRVQVDDVPTAASPLALAAMRGDLPEISRLLDEGADVNVTDALGRTPLHMAAFYGRGKASELLLVRGAIIDAKDRVGMTPLHAAVLAVNRQQVELLLDHKAAVNARSDIGQTPLHLAAATGQPKVARSLIERGADPQARDKDGNTPLYYASRNLHPVSTEFLQQYAAKSNNASGK